MAHTSERRARAAKPAAKGQAQAAHGRKLPPAHGAGASCPCHLGRAYAMGPAVTMRSSIQTKLVVGQSGDKYEREADHVAERVATGHPVGEVSRIPAGGLGAQRMDDDAGSEPQQKAEPPKQPVQKGETNTAPAQAERRAQGPESTQREGNTDAQAQREEDDTAQSKSGEKLTQRDEDTTDVQAQREEDDTSQSKEDDKPAQREEDQADAQAQRAEDEDDAAQRRSNDMAAQTKCAACEAKEKRQKQDDRGDVDRAQRKCAACAAKEKAQRQEESGNGEAAASDTNVQRQAAGADEEEVPEEDQPDTEAGDEEGPSRDCPPSTESAGAEEDAGGAGAEPEATEGAAGEEAESEGAEDEAEGGEGGREPDDLGCGEEGGGEGEAPAEAAAAGGQSCGAGGEEATEGAEGGGGLEGTPAPPQEDTQAPPAAPAPPCADSVPAAEEREGDPASSEPAAEGGGGGAGGGAGGECGTAQRKDDDRSGKRDPRGLDTGTASRLIHSRGAGEPLTSNVKHRLEHSLGIDINGIRVHSDSNAHAANRALRAKAFTHRNHIFLGAGQSQHDMNLMAHESTHVLQQDALVRRKAVDAEPLAGVSGEAGASDDSRMRAAGMPRTGRGSPLALSSRAERDAPPPRAESGPPRSGPGPHPTRERAVTGMGSAVRAPGLGNATFAREERGGVIAQVGAQHPATEGALAMAAPVPAGAMPPPPAAKGAAVGASAVKGVTPPPPAKRGEAERPIPRAAKAVDGKAGGKTKAGAKPAKGKAASRKALPVLPMPPLPPPASTELPEPIAATPPVTTSGPVVQGRGQQYDAFRARASVDELVAGMADAAEKHKSVHRERAATAKAKIADDASQQKLAAFGAAAQAGQDIDNTVQAARVAIAAHAAAFKALTPIQALTGWTQVLGATTEQVGKLQKSKQDQQTAARQQVTSHQAEARKFGADEGKRGKDAIVAQAQEALTRGESKASGYTADEAGRVQANAVRSVAAKVSAELMKPADRIQDEAVKQGNTLADGLAGSADSAIASMDEQAQVVGGQLSASAIEQLPSFQAMGVATGQAIDQLVVQVNAQLDTVDTEARTQLGLVRVGLDNQFDAAVRAGHAAVDNQLLSVDAATDTIAGRAMKTARGLARPDPDRVRQALRGVDKLLGQASEGFDEGLGEMERISADSFGQAGTAATTQLAQISTSTQSHLATVVQAAFGGTKALFDKQIEEQDQALTKWKGGLTEAQTGVEAEWTKEVKQIGEKLDDGVKKGKAPITKGVDDGVKKNGEVLAKLDGQMREAAEDALYRYEHPIRAKLKAAFWGALKALGMLVLIVGLFFVGLALLIVGLISGAIALVVAGILILAAVVGFVIYGLISGIVNRIRSATSVGEGIAGFFIGILDITGIPNIIEGITEKDLVNGRQLTLEEAGERLGGGIVGFLALIIPFAKGAKGRAPKMPLEVAPEVAPKLPVEAPTPRVEPPTPRVEPPPVEPPKVEAPRVEAPKVEAPKVEPPTVEPPKTEPPTAQPPKAESPTVQPPKPHKAEPPKTEPPKTEPPKTEPPATEPKVEPSKTEATKGKPETQKSAAELGRQLEKDGLTSEEIQGFFHDLNASELSPGAAGRVRTLRSYFTTKDLKALGKYLYEKDLVLDDAAVKGLMREVKPGEMRGALRKADIAEVLGESKRPPGAKTEGSVLEDPKARAEVTEKPSPGRVPAPFERGNFVHRFAEFILSRRKLPRPSEAEVVVQVRNAKGEIVPGKIIRTDRMIRNTKRGLLLEIKPRGKSAAKGRAELPARLDALQNQYPKPQGWKGRVVTYSRREVETWLRSEGVSEAEIPALMKELGF